MKTRHLPVEDGRSGNRSLRRAFAAIALAALTLLLEACTIAPDAQPNDPTYAPVSAPPKVSEPASVGSLYSPGNNMSLFDDKRAHHIGDVITIVLSEKTSSSKKADTSIKKDDSVSLDAGLVLGAQPKIGGVNMGTSVNPKRQFDGGASSDQSNSLSGTITVMVANILPNGLLEVRGEKWMTLNNGQEYIRLRGYIRPEDVLPDNSISSTRVADVHIAYSGNGALAQSNRQGWLSRFFSSEYWPF